MVAHASGCNFQTDAPVLPLSPASPDCQARDCSPATALLEREEERAHDAKASSFAELTASC